FLLLSIAGMLHGGHSLQVFKKWCSDPKNMIIMPGYCVAGTVGAKVIGGMKQIEMDGRMFDINLGVEYMSFSAHADAKGIMQLIRDCEPRNVMFVHGEAGKMEFLKDKVEKEFGLRVYKPANGETVSIPASLEMDIEVPAELIHRSISLDPTPAKRACPFRASLLLDKQSSTLEVLSTEAAAAQFAFQIHTITHSEYIQTEKDINWKELARSVRSNVDMEMQQKADGIEAFDGDVVVMKCKDDSRKVELMWTENMDSWQPQIAELIRKAGGGGAVAN
ncbi:hypothetical protein PFISCL1PPCAC_29205, partial [Pristionchus fissidentatus]